MLTIISAN